MSSGRQLAEKAYRGMTLLEHDAVMKVSWMCGDEIYERGPRLPLLSEEGGTEEEASTTE